MNSKMNRFIPEIGKQLLPDENILFETKKHYIIFLTPVIWTLAAIGFLMVTNPLVNKAAFIPGVIAVLSWINEALNYYVSEFIITTKRIIMQEGFFFRHTNELRLATVSNVNVNQSLLAQLLNYGTIIIYPFGGKADPFMNVDSPNEFQKQLQMQLDKLVK